jgi:hypothetical protein
MKSEGQASVAELSNTIVATIQFCCCQSRQENVDEADIAFTPSLTVTLYLLFGRSIAHAREKEWYVLERDRVISPG